MRELFIVNSLLICKAIDEYIEWTSHLVTMEAWLGSKPSTTKHVDQVSIVEGMFINKTH